MALQTEVWRVSDAGESLGRQHSPELGNECPNSPLSQQWLLLCADGFSHLSSSGLESAICRGAVLKADCPDPGQC